MIAKDVLHPVGAVATVSTCLRGERAPHQGLIWSKAASNPADRFSRIRGPVDGLGARMFNNNLLSGFDVVRATGSRDRDGDKLDCLNREDLAVTMSPSGARGDVDLKHVCLWGYDAW